MSDYEIAISLLDSQHRYSQSKINSNPDLVKQTTTVQDIWNYDNNKLLLAESKGIKLIQLWEYDINNNFDLIKKQLGELFQQFPKE